MTRRKDNSFFRRGFFSRRPVGGALREEIAGAAEAVRAGAVFDATGTEIFCPHWEQAILRPRISSRILKTALHLGQRNRSAIFGSALITVEKEKVGLSSRESRQSILAALGA